jgi:predicted ribosomally synthesized peptide with nif11-like leader
MGDRHLLTQEISNNMSTENAKQMIQIVQQDETVRNQIEAGATNPEAALNLTVSLGKEQGLNFSADEFQRELAARGMTVGSNGELQSLSGTIGTEGELSEDALEAVAGGFYYGAGRNCSQW